jgi:hypothetical protein
MSNNYLVDYENYKNPAKTIIDMGVATGLPLVRIAEVIPNLARDILRTWHSNGAAPDFDLMVENAFEKIFNYSYKNRADRIVPLMLKGPPGQGKTTAFRQALSMIANAMSVNLLINPTSSQVPKKTDIVVVEAQLAGLLSATPLLGIPSAGSEDDPNLKGTTVYLPPARLKKLVNSHFSLFLLDDLENATPAIKNVTLPAILDKILSELDLGKNCYVGATGNLGSLDGTNTTAGSDALYNRMETVLGYDTIGDWIQRNQANHQDEIGLCFLDEFFIQHPEMFYPNRDSKLRGPTATSRSYDGLLSTLRNQFGDFIDQQSAGLNPPPITSAIRTKLQGQIGIKASTGLELFYKDVLSLAFPAAREAMSKDRLSDPMKNQLETLFTKSRGPEVESVARSYLRQLQQIAGDRLFSTLNQPQSDDSIFHQKQALATASRYTDAIYGVGLIKGNRSNNIAQSIINLAGNLIQRSEALPTTERHFDFGTISERGLPVPSSAITKLLTSTAAKSGNEALLRVGGTDNEPITALQTTLIDPLTQSSQAITMDQEVLDAKRSGTQPH